MRRLVLVSLLGCGRVGFDASAPDARRTEGVPRSVLRFDREAPYLDETILGLPVPITLDASRADLAKLTRETLRAFADDGTELPVEIESTGPPLVAWIRVPVIAGTSTTMSIEYGGDPRPDALLPSVWDDTYLGVWHMTIDARESTRFSRASEPTALTEIDGVVGRASHYTPAQDSCIVVPSFANLTWNELTLVAWVRLDAVPPGPTQYFSAMTRQDGDTLEDDFFLGVEPANRAIGAMRTDTAGSPSRVGPVLALGPWQMLAFKYNGMQSDLLVDSSATTGGGADGIPITNDRPLMIGCGRNGAVTATNVPTGDIIDGDLDEVQIHRVFRSASWLHHMRLGHLDQLISYGPFE